MARQPAPAAPAVPRTPPPAPAIPGRPPRPVTPPWPPPPPAPPPPRAPPPPAAPAVPALPAAPPAPAVPAASTSASGLASGTGRFGVMVDPSLFVQPPATQPRAQNEPGNESETPSRSANRSQNRREEAINGHRDLSWAAVGRPAEYASSAGPSKFRAYNSGRLAHVRSASAAVRFPLAIAARNSRRRVGAAVEHVVLKRRRPGFVNGVVLAGGHRRGSHQDQSHDHHETPHQAILVQVAVRALKKKRRPVPRGTGAFLSIRSVAAYGYAAVVQTASASACGQCVAGTPPPVGPCPSTPQHRWYDWQFASRRCQPRRRPCTRQGPCSRSRQGNWRAGFRRRPGR